MPGDSLGHLEIARQHWLEGQALEAGRLIFEALPPESRPKWAARILRLVIDKSGVEKGQFERTLYAQTIRANGPTDIAVSIRSGARY